MKIKNILILLLITVTLCGCDKKDPSSDDRPKETPNVAPELNMGRMINHINHILILSDFNRWNKILQIYWR